MHIRSSYMLHECWLYKYPPPPPPLPNASPAFGVAKFGFGQFCKYLQYNFGSDTGFSQG